MSVLLGTLALRSPDRGNPFRVVKRQAMRRTVGGTLYVYDKGVRTFEFEWTFTELTETERDSLQTFFDTTADGMVNTFTVKDWYGDTFTDCRFLDPVLEFAQTDEHRELSNSGIYSCTLRFEGTPESAEGGESGEDS